MRKKKLRNTRPKALFGELAAAGIQAAATLAAAGIQARQMASSAKEQANAQMQGAQLQAKSIEETNQNNNNLQEQSQQFIATENEANRQLQRDWQMNMQLAQGMLTSDDRRAESRIQVKKGGKVSRKKLRDAFFYGGGNLPFRVTDGGGVLPLGQTPEGYDLYEIVGNDHDHYHKTRSGKYKSGVGIEFAMPNYTDNRLSQSKGGKAAKVVEGEGNQNTGQGELLLMTPDSGRFISKHSNKGFNPAQAVMDGMHPLMAYNIQENLKGSSPVKGRYAAKAGVYVAPLLATGYPAQDLNFDMTGPNSAYIMSRPSLKRGGRCKAAWGYPSNWHTYPNNGYAYGNSSLPIGRPYTQPNTWSMGNINFNLGNLFAPKGNGWSTGNVHLDLNGLQIPGQSKNGGRNDYGRSGISGNLWGAGLTALGNLGGAWLTSWGANRASKYLSKAYTDSAELLAGAYDKLKGVDMNSLKREDFAGAHYMPVVQSVYQNVNPQLENTNREFRRLMRATNAGTLSTAARLSRQAGANSAAAEQRSAIYADQANREAQARLQNTQMINEAAAKNAEMDIQARRDYMGHYVDLLKYNNDIANERITGRAQAIADGMLGAAGTRATAMQTTGQSWGNAIAGSGQAFGNAFATDAAQAANIRMALAGASSTGQYNYYMSGNNYDRSGAYGVYSDYVAMSKSAKDSRDRDEWLFRANQLAKKYNFPSV